MNLDLSSLRSVIAAAEHGSFRQAATALNIKQSALSRRIRHLEGQLGVSLFERSSGGVRPTPAGASMSQASRRLFAEIDHMVTASQLADRGEAGVLKAGFGTAVSTSKVRTILADHIKSFPHIGIQVTERSPAQLAAALGTGDVDVAIIAGEARQHNGPSMSLWSERIVAALSSRHPLSNSEVIDWSDLKDEIFLLSQWDPGLDLRNLILKKLAAPGDAPKIETWDASNENVLGMIEAGLHVSVHCESWTSLSYPGVRFREIRDSSGPSHITFTACWEEHNRNPALARFVETLRQTHHPTTLS
ncbi:LysR family transcriptional regulator [Reyranella aquatilis]|uniref:LysR family transcriptional regulator n=2 Tax=Reyranella aquatilis TaxID=2035356 RepID=A0ABS8KX04_9HYPH|nr:LysR family transcriptional regulator [Reyranella aquatilis]